MGMEQDLVIIIRHYFNEINMAEGTPVIILDPIDR